MECHLQVGFGSEPESIVLEDIPDRIFKKTVAVDKEGHLFVKVTTNNYALYSVVVQKQSTAALQVELEKLTVETYLTEPD